MAEKCPFSDYIVQEPLRLTVRDFQTADELCIEFSYALVDFSKKCKPVDVQKVIVPRSMAKIPLIPFSYMSPSALIDALESNVRSVLPILDGIKSKSISMYRDASPYKTANSPISSFGYAPLSLSHVFLQTCSTNRQLTPT